MFDLFARSWQGLNLSPGERAFVKLAEGWLITALLAGFAIAYQLLMSGSADYGFIFRSAGGAALLSVFLAFKKYLSAQSDLPLPTASLATRPTPSQPPQSGSVIAPVTNDAQQMANLPPAPSKAWVMVPASQVTPIPPPGEVESPFASAPQGPQVPFAPLRDFTAPVETMPRQ